MKRYRYIFIAQFKAIIQEQGVMWIEGIFWLENQHVPRIKLFQGHAQFHCNSNNDN